MLGSFLFSLLGTTSRSTNEPSNHDRTSGSTSSKTLLLLRHAQSRHGTIMSAGTIIIDRPWTATGRQAALRLGNYLQAQNSFAKPDLISASPSLRTRLRNVGVRPTQWLGRPQFRGVSGMSVGTIWMLIPTLLLLLEST